jgi:hypothetical protein
MDKSGASLTPAPPSLVPALARPVFLDVTGRRRRWLRRAGLVLAAGALAYLLALASVLPGPPALAPVRVQVPPALRRPPVTVTGPLAEPAARRLGTDRS